MGPLEQEVELLLDAGGDDVPRLAKWHTPDGLAEFSELEPLTQNMVIYSRLLAIETAIRRIARAVDRGQKLSEH
jgi:hypothetical protein